jgi:predicted GIY-YIG superfamily endonuclease
MGSSGVYLLQCPYEGIVILKIGFSKNVVKRLKQHQTSNPYIVPLGYIETKDYKQLEKDIHYKARMFKIKKEWFLNKEQIKNYFKNHEHYKNYTQ